MKIHYFPVLASTNDTAKEMAQQGCGHGTVVIAGYQTAGRGRMGRSFYSPPASGLYMSMVLRPAALPFNPLLVTPAAAVAVCRAIQSVAGQDAAIKWVNDVFLRGKKIGGILAEAVPHEWVAVGIGINICTMDFPPTINETAGSIFTDGNGGNFNRLLADRIIEIMLPPDFWSDDGALISEYKSKMFMLGQVVTVHSGGISYDAVALDVDSTGGLIVKKANGEITALSTGEVSIRCKNPVQ